MHQWKQHITITTIIIIAAPPGIDDAGVSQHNLLLY